MTSRALAPIALASLLIALLSATPPPAWADAWTSKLERGEVLVYSRPANQDLKEVILKAIIDAPPAEVWKLVDKCGRYSETMSRVKEAKELKRQGEKVTCRITIDMPFPYSDMTSVTEAIHREKKGVYTRTWRLLKGDYKENRGSWTLRPHGGGQQTLVVYRVVAEPEAWTPDWVREKAQKRTLPDMIARMRRLVRR